MRKYVKMNDNDNYLSLGNLFRIIKEISKNTSNSVQTEIFCLLFNVESINATTVNNYCVGLRRIGNVYKQTYLNWQKKYQKNIDVMADTILRLISVIEGHNIDVNDKIDYINKHELFRLLATKLVFIMKNDKKVSTNIVDKINSLIKQDNYYEAFCELLFYIVLENKQPRFYDEEIKDSINDIIAKSNISYNDIKDILEIELCEGLSYYRSLLELAEKNNPYALYKLARMEYLGEVDGNQNIDKTLAYLLKASEFNHPASLWMMAHLFLKRELFDEVDYQKVWYYLNKAYEMGSVASINTMGLCYLNGWTIDGHKDIAKALDCFNEAIRHNYVYSYNNLGKYYENAGLLDKAMSYYLISANEKESWACNKVGEIYRNRNDFSNAFKYYQMGTLSSINEICPYVWHNLAQYFYLNGCMELNIRKDLFIAKELLRKSAKYLLDSKILLLYLLINDYQNNYDEIQTLKSEIEQDTRYNSVLKEKIENKIKDHQSLDLNLD